MKVVYRSRYGSPDVLILKEREKPVPGENELLIRVKAATVNRTDCARMTGSPYVMRLLDMINRSTKVMGTDFAGIVTEVGGKVKNFVVGDKVWGFSDEGLGSQAEYMKISTDMPIEHIPQGYTFSEVVTSAEGAHYAINSLNKVHIPERSKILVNGATGAIGTAMMQLLRQYDVNVIAVGDTPNIDLMKSLGAVEVIDYTKENFTEVLTENFDFIFDAVGKSAFDKCKHLLKENGIYISSELGPGAENIYLPLWTKIKGGKRVMFPFPSDIKASLKKMNEMLVNRTYSPVIDRIYPLNEYKKAYQYVCSGQKTGNVVLEL